MSNIRFHTGFISGPLAKAVAKRYNHDVIHTGKK